jgi:hypothetical protein
MENRAREIFTFSYEISGQAEVEVDVEVERGRRWLMLALLWKK